MAHILSTERLVLREFESDDAPFILDLLNTESWIKYIGDRNVRTIAAAETYLQKGPINSYRQHGYGLWMVSLKDKNTHIGMCGIIKRDTLEEPDLGFAFLPAFTGKGFAVESATAALRFAFDRLDLSRLLAITLPENNGSIRLLEKIGMSLQEEIRWMETDEILLKYAVDRAS